MNYIIVLIACFVMTSCASFDEIDKEWVEWKRLHKKTYKTKEENDVRMKIFRDRKEKISEHNELHAQGKVGFSMKMNHFGDLLDHELNNIFSGYINNESASFVDSSAYSGVSYVEPHDLDLPRHVDWRLQGAVTEVKSQYYYDPCGSCWAFGAVGALEGQYYRKTGKLISLSAQQLVECSFDFGNYGCNGGWTTNAFEYIAKNGGIETDASYPYKGCNKEDLIDKLNITVDIDFCDVNDYKGNNSTSYCHFDPAKVETTMKGYARVKKGDEESLKSAVATVGPISVSMNVVDNMRFYHKGVYDDKQCGHNLEHEVLLVGYGTERVQTHEWPYYKDMDYWLIKNEWGTYWGDDGYIKILRDAANLCGITLDAKYPLI